MREVQVKCKYCGAALDIFQDNDRMPGGLYSKIYPCTNKDCGAVYEEWTTEQGKSVPEKNRWFNPKTNIYE